MIIEFFGEPGSGKTTLLKSTASALGARAVYVRVDSSIEALARSLLFALAHPAKAFFWFAATVKESRGLFRYKMALVVRSLAAVQKASGVRREVVLIDEGLLQRVLSVYDRLLSDEEIRRVLAHAHTAERVVVCRGGDFSRFVSEPDRFNSPRVRAGEEHLRQWIATVRANASRIAAVLMPLGGTIFIDAKERGAAETLIQSLGVPFK